MLQCRMSRISRIGTAAPASLLSRRAWLASALGATAGLVLGGPSLAAKSPAFARWIAGFRPRAIRRGISEATYDPVIGALTPDSTVYEQQRAQPEFTEQVWQYRSE